MKLDLRSLAALRIGCALLLLADLYSRSQDLQAHYSEAGVLPLAQLTSWTLHGDGVTALLVVQAALAILLGLGFATRFVTPLSWLLLVSLQHRNPLVATGGDQELRMVLFFAIFCPWGERWSLDQRGHPPHESVLSVAGVALQLQIVGMYWMTAIHKVQTGWDGTAVAWALRGPYARVNADWLGDLSGLSYFVLVSEFVAPLALLAPRTRLWGIAWLALLHVGFGLFLELGLFAWISTTMLVVFVPGRLWDRWSIPGVGQPPAGQPWVNGFGLFALLYILSWNLAELRPQGQRGLPTSLAWLGPVVGWEQYWRMFAPVPAEAGWIVVEAGLSSGEKVDLWTQAPVTWTRPTPFPAHFQNVRWYLYFRSVLRGRAPVSGLTGYLRRRWERSHPESPVQSTNVVYLYYRLATPDLVHRRLLLERREPSVRVAKGRSQGDKWTRREQRPRPSNRPYESWS